MLIKDLVINEFDKGIAGSAHLGIEDMRNMDISSIPGAIGINFKTSALNKPATVSGLSYSVGTNDTFTVSSTSGWYNGMAVTLNTVVTAVGISTGRVYWVGDLTSTTFKLYKNPGRTTAHLVDVTTAGTGTLSSYTISTPIDYTIDYDTGFADGRKYVLILDDNGRVWWIDNKDGTLTSNLIYMGNTTLTGTGGRAIEKFGNDFIVFRAGHVDKMPNDYVEGDVDFNLFGWTYGFDTVSSVDQSVRPTLVGQDNILYFGNNDRVGSFNSSLTKNSSVLDLMGNDVLSLGELGRNLLVGGVRNFIYPWDRSSSSFNLPIKVSDNGIYRIVNANSLAYIFAGTTGHIYVTNGTATELFKKVPNHVTGVDGPYFVWKDAMSISNQLYFSVAAYRNDGTSLDAMGGVWAIDLKTGALRQTNKLSYATYGGSATILIPHIFSSTPPGNGLYIGWANGSTYGVDVSASTYYDSYAAYFISLQYIVGTHKNKADVSEAEITLEKELASGEGVRLSFRKNRSDSWSTPVTFDYSTHQDSAHINLPFIANEVVTLQVKVEATGSTTTPVIKELRIR